MSPGTGWDRGLIDHNVIARAWMNGVRMPRTLPWEMKGGRTLVTPRNDGGRCFMTAPDRGGFFIVMIRYIASHRRSSSTGELLGMDTGVPNQTRAMRIFGVCNRGW